MGAGRRGARSLPIALLLGGRNLIPASLAAKPGGLAERSPAFHLFGFDGVVDRFRGLGRDAAAVFGFVRRQLIAVLRHEQRRTHLSHVATSPRPDAASLPADGPAGLRSRVRPGVPLWYAAAYNSPTLVVGFPYA